MNVTYKCPSLDANSLEKYLSSKFPDRPVNALIIMLASFSALGLIGNSLVLYVYVRKRNKLSSTVFIIALAATDLVTSVVSMPYTMVLEGLNYHITYDFTCKLYYFFITCTVPFSVFIMVAIAADRYICICRPHSHVLDSKRARNSVLVLLLLAILIGIVPAMFHGVYIDSNTLKKKEIGFQPIEKEVRQDFENITEILNMLHGSSCHECVNNSATNDDYATQLVKLVVELYKKVCTRANPANESYIYTGQCLPNQIIFSERFRFSYQTVYSSSFLVCFSVVFVLYILIYKSVLVRRARRYASRSKSLINHTQDFSLTENQSMLNESPDKSIALAEISNGNHDGSTHRTRPALPQNQSLLKEPKSLQKQMSEGGSQKNSAPNNGCLRDKYFLANIRTAVMLFVVTIFFIIAYLPSWLIAYKVIPFNVIVFYVYFSNHSVNPIIYAFMNPAFRRSLKALICRQPVRSL
ncbi:cephalotocin receptor 1 [Biomphalaria pfeifferi]|uniref:Cephalotocin receptor 1 n=1 Tax=Biomphalaria pfeifferi TaxID=112525 RepID=A0AAD8C2R6_BIOPF|nr:cephalotocin receptor 1 [Biomphalaria pfeifferi]